MGAATAVAAIGAAASVKSSIDARKGAKEQLRAQNRAIEASRVEIQPFNFFGPGGQVAGFTPARTAFNLSNPANRSGPRFNTGLPGERSRLLSNLAGSTSVPGGAPQLGFLNPNHQSIMTNLGDLEPARAGLVQFANQQLAEASDSGLPPGVQQALLQSQNLAGSGFDADLSTLGFLEQGVGQQFGFAQQGLNDARSGFQRGLQDALFQGAGNLASTASQDPQAVADERLALLREQARPFEERQFQDLQENLFSTGRLGTTGGALQTEAFARGLGQADLSRQLAASAEGRATQDQALRGTQGLATAGGALRSLDENLLFNAFGRFRDTVGLGADLSGERFRRNQGLRALLGADTQQNLQNQLQVAGLPNALQSQDLNQVLQALQGQSGLNQQGQENFQTALNAAIAQANARTGSASNIANITNNSNFGAVNDANSAIFSSIANNAGTFVNAFSGLFNQGGGGTTDFAGRTPDLTQISATA